MGFFKSIFKGVKKVFKKIGRGIKKIAGKVGKFVGKLGIVGQIGLAILLPGIGGALGSVFSGATKALSAYAGFGSTVVNGIGKVLSFAGKFASSAGKLYKGVTNAIGGFVKKIGGEVLNKVGFKSFGTGDGISKAFQGWMDSSAEGFKGVLDPFKSVPVAGSESLLGPTKTTSNLQPDISPARGGSPLTDVDFQAATPSPMEAYSQVSEGIESDFLATQEAVGTDSMWGDFKDEVVAKTKKTIGDTGKQMISNLLNPQPEYDEGGNQVQPFYTQSNPLVQADQTQQSLGYTVGGPMQYFQQAASQSSSTAVYNQALTRALGGAS